MDVLTLKEAHEMTKGDIRIVLNAVWLVAGRLERREHHEAYGNLQRAVEAVEVAYFGRQTTDCVPCPVCNYYACNCPQDDGDAVGQMMGENK